MSLSPYLFGYLLGYALGSIPFGLLLTKLFGAQDPREIGSGNIGATNVLRTGRKGLAAATLLLDLLKGTAAVLLARYFLGEGAALAAGLGAFLGHLFPVWLGFRGGKGVATYIGVLFGLAWPAAIFFCAIWLAVGIITRYSSLAALVASALAPIAVWQNDLVPQAVLFAALTAMLWFMHRENIKRLLAGTETKIGKKASAA